MESRVLFVHGKEIRRMNIGWKDRADVTRVREELRKLGIEEEIIAIVD